METRRGVVDWRRGRCAGVRTLVIWTPEVWVRGRSCKRGGRRPERRARLGMQMGILMMLQRRRRVRDTGQRTLAETLRCLAMARGGRRRDGSCMRDPGVCLGRRALWVWVTRRSRRRCVGGVGVGGSVLLVCRWMLVGGQLILMLRAGGDLQGRQRRVASILRGGLSSLGNFGRLSLRRLVFSIVHQSTEIHPNTLALRMAGCSLLAFAVGVSRPPLFEPCAVRTHICTSPQLFGEPC